MATNSTITGLPSASALTGLELFPLDQISGTGLITVNASLGTISAYIRGLSTNVTNYYCNASFGSDSNNGLSVGEPFQTVQAAVNASLNYGPVTNGTFVANLAGGTYASNITFPQGFQGLNYFQINGPSGALPYVPQAIISGGTFGITMNGSNSVLLQNIFIENQNNAGNGYGVVCQTNSQLYLINCYFSNCDNSVKALQSRLYMVGGIVMGGVTGITAIGCSIPTVGFTATSAGTTGGLGMGPYITGCSQRGLLYQESGTGHGDYTTINNCVIGADIVGSSRLNSTGSVFTNNATCGVRAWASSHFLNNGLTCTFSGNGTPELYYTGGMELTRSGQYAGFLRPPIDTSPITQTGTIARTAAVSYASIINPTSFNTPSKALKGRIAGQVTGTNGTKTIDITLDGTTVFSFAIPQAYTGAYRIDYEIDCYSSPGTQIYDAVCVLSGGNNLLANGSITATLSAGTIVVNGTLPGSGDTIFYRVRSFDTIGGA